MSTEKLWPHQRASASRLVGEWVVGDLVCRTEGILLHGGNLDLSYVGSPRLVCEVVTYKGPYDFSVAEVLIDEHLRTITGPNFVMSVGKKYSNHWINLTHMMHEVGIDAVKAKLVELEEYRRVRSPASLF
jgi:hypothetical protein